MRSKRSKRVDVRWRPDMFNTPHVVLDDEAFKWVSLQYGNGYSDPVLSIDITLPRFVVRLIVWVVSRV